MPTTATAAITGYSDTHPMISRSSAMDVTSVAIGDESYSFLAEPNAQGHLIASNGNLLVDKNEGTGMADGTQQTAGREAMTIVGERQTSAHTFN